MLPWPVVESWPHEEAFIMAIYLESMQRTVLIEIKCVISRSCITRPHQITSITSYKNVKENWSLLVAPVMHHVELVTHLYCKTNVLLSWDLCRLGKILGIIPQFMKTYKSCDDVALCCEAMTSLITAGVTNPKRMLDTCHNKGLI